MKTKKCETPIYNHENSKWEVWDLAYIEDGERHYEVHRFYEYIDAIKFYNSRKNDTSKK